MGRQRLASLDAFRGMTIAAMILVNNPGTWRHVYAPLRHADWHGWTVTDLIFPFFLFIVGVSLTFSFAGRVEEGRGGGRLYLQVFRRSLLLFGIGLALRLFPDFRLAYLRIPGVLQRIAVCFLLASLVYLTTQRAARVGLIVLLLAGYWLAMKLIPVPGYGAGDLSYYGNLAGFIDTRLLAGHLYEPVFDPEGLLSTLPSLATTLLGTLCGDFLRSSATLVRKARGLLVSGVVLTAAGLVLHPYFPINKKLWTSTFVLFTAGAALILLSIFFGLIEVRRFRAWSYPFLVLGTNAIALYAGSILLAKILMRIQVVTSAGRISFWAFLYDKLLAPRAGATFGSLLYALLYLGLWIGIALPLYRKKIVIKI